MDRRAFPALLRVFAIFYLFFLRTYKNLASPTAARRSTCQNGVQLHRLILQSFLFAFDNEKCRPAKQHRRTRDHGRDFPPVVIQPQLDALTVWHFDYYGRQR